MIDLPRIRIEVDSMRYQIIHALAAHNDEIEKAVEEELVRVIENYPFREQVSKLASDALTKSIKAAIEDYFLYGKGKDEIMENVSKILSRINDE